MPNISVKSQIESQLPGYIVENSNGKLQRFLEYYYDFLESEGNYNNFSRSIIKYLDTDKSPESVIDTLFEEFSSIPHLISADKRLFLKNIYDFYQSKGTENSFRLLFRAFFNSDLEISYPSSNILRASDGKWLQDIELVIETTYGAFASNDELLLEFTPSSGSAYFKKSKNNTQINHGASYWVKFDASTGVNASVGDIVRQYNSTGTIVMMGKVKSVPTSLNINVPGAKFRVGQVFSIPGTYRDTVFRVSSINTTGGITSTQIIQFGYGHSIGTTAFTPYAYPPSGSSVSVSQVLTSPGIYTYQLGISETIYGVRDVFNGNYIADTYAPGYTVSGYTAQPFVPLDTNIPNGALVGIPSFGLSVADYTASIASISINFGNVSRYKGKYLTTESMLSEPTMVLQDNFYYQAYSYVLSSSKRLSDYKDTVLKLAHPAGMKYFSNINKSNQIDVRSYFIADKTTTYQLHFEEVIDQIVDTIAKASSQSILDSVTSDDSNFTKSLTTAITDSFTIDDSNFGKAMFSNFADALASPSDAFGKNQNISVVEPVTSEAIRFVVQGYWDETYSAISASAPGATFASDSVSVA